MAAFIAKSDTRIAVAGRHTAIVTRLRRIRHQRLVQIVVATVSLQLALIVLLHSRHNRVAVRWKVAANCSGRVAATLDTEFARQNCVLCVHSGQHDEDVAAVRGLFAQRCRHDAEITFVLFVAGAAECDTATGVYGDGGAAFIFQTQTAGEHGHEHRRMIAFFGTQSLDAAANNLENKYSRDIFRQIQWKSKLFYNKVDTNRNEKNWHIMFYINILNNF